MTPVQSSKKEADNADDLGLFQERTCLRSHGAAIISNTPHAEPVLALNGFIRSGTIVRGKHVFILISATLTID